MNGLAFPRRIWAITSLSGGTALLVLDAALPAVALPTIAREFSVAPTSAILVITVYQLIFVMVILPFSALGERIGLRVLYRGGLVLFVIASAFAGLAQSMPTLLFARALQALGAAAILSVTSACLRSIYPASMLGRGIAINSAVVSSANAFAPALAGILLAFAPWQWIFVAAVPLGLLSLIASPGLPDSPASNNRRYDWSGALLCAATFGLLTCGLEMLVRGYDWWLVTAILSAGIGISLFFVRRELSLTYPILPLDLLRQPTISLSVLGALFVFIASMVVLLTLPFIFEQTYGFEAAEIGALIAPWPVAIMITAPLLSLLSDRISPAFLGVGGMACAIAGLAAMAMLPANPQYADIAWRMALCGAGFGAFLAPNVRILLSATPKDRTASAGGLIATTRLTGQVLGATFASALLAMGKWGEMAAIPFAVFLCILAGICCLTRSTDPF